jgi:CheY-like chemotaxis protein
MGKKENPMLLVVEDDLMSFKLIEAHMKKTRFDLIHAKNGLEAVELFSSAEHPIDAIIMDLQLPAMSGLDATKAIRKLDGDILIIAVTANVTADDKIACEEAGCSYHLSKPLNFPVLLSLLDKHIT